MANELRRYLVEVDKAIKAAALPTPSCLVAAVMLPTGSTKLAVNTEHIPEKIAYILSAYDDEMRLKTNAGIIMQSVRVI